MQQHRAYVLSPDGHITFRHDLLCADDEEAKGQTKQLVDGRGRAIELWQEARQVATFEPL
jgi:hypothetical protein